MSEFTVYDLLSRNLRENSGRTALVQGDEAVTYGQLATRVESLAAQLQSRGVGAGDRVGIHLPKCIDEVVATFAVARLGAVFVNINSQWTLHQLEYIVRDCGVRVLFTDVRRAKLIERSPIAADIEHVLVRGRVPCDVPPQSGDPLGDAKSPASQGAGDQEMAALLYTSGSTGNPKGVMLSHRNIVLGAQSVSTYLKNTSDDRILSLLPLSFDYGLSQVTTMFLVGGCVVLQSVSFPAELAKTMASKDVTGVALVPPSWVQLVRFLEECPTKFPSLRYITNSGGKIPQGVLRSFSEVFPKVEIFLMYGLTEAFRSTYLPPDLFHEKMGSIGRAIPNAEVFVVHPQHGVCGKNGQGELIHRGELISMGYWNNQEASDEKIRPNAHLASIIGDEKVLHSGDLVRVDEDGCLWFVGRLDSMIKCSGFRLSPTEVEEVLCAHSRVMEAVAFGVEDEELGQVVHAVVSMDAGAGLSEGELISYSRKTMANYMVPRCIKIVEEGMPRTANGKLDRQQVISEFAERTAARQND